MAFKKSIKIVLLAAFSSIPLSSGQEETRDVHIESDELDGEHMRQFTTDPVEYLRSDEVTVNYGQLTNKPSLAKTRFQDSLWKMQWYLQDYRLELGPVMDLNILPVFDMGITGKDIVIAVVDDGIQVQPDLEKNLLEDLSFSYVDNSPGSVPLEKQGFVSSHGTKVAGVIAMEAGSNFCGIGIAHEAKICDVKVIGRKGTHVHHEAQGLVHKLGNIDIYSNSWGPEDTADHMKMTGYQVALSLKKGATQGRAGLGSIYVFPSGNGKQAGDNCGADAHLNNPFTFGIASASQWGKVTPYGESCSALIATVYAIGEEDDEGIVSTDLEGRCTMGFKSRAAAAPIGSAIIALLLQHKRELTRRDVMHIIARSAEVAPLANNPGTWKKNAAGFWVSDDFGFGLMNAKNMINVADKWTHVGDENACTEVLVLRKPKYLKTGSNEEFSWEMKACQEEPDKTVNYLESLSLFCDINYSYRGALHIKLKSPKGTETSVLLPRRKDTSSTSDFISWGFKSLRTWGEDPKGIWTVTVQVEDFNKGAVYNLVDGIYRWFTDPTVQFAGYEGSVASFRMVLRGTLNKPQPGDRSSKQRKTYAAFRLPNNEGEQNNPPPKTQSRRRHA